MQAIFTTTTPDAAANYSVCRHAVALDIQPTDAEHTIAARHAQYRSPGQTPRGKPPT